MSTKSAILVTCQSLVKVRQIMPIEGVVGVANCVVNLRHIDIYFYVDNDNHHTNHNNYKHNYDYNDKHNYNHQYCTFLSRTPHHGGVVSEKFSNVVSFITPPIIKIRRRRMSQFWYSKNLKN